MSYCRIHGQYEGSYGCPDCRDAERNTEASQLAALERLSALAEEAEGSRADLADLKRSIVDAIRNPGDFVCPYCRLRTLKSGASVCPQCHRGISQTDWEAIHREVQKEASRRRDAEEERERLDGAKRERAARDAELDRERQAQVQARKNMENAYEEEKQRELNRTGCFFFSGMVVVLVIIAICWAVQSSGR